MHTTSKYSLGQAQGLALPKPPGTWQQQHALTAVPQACSIQQHRRPCEAVRTQASRGTTDATSTGTRVRQGGSSPAPKSEARDVRPVPIKLVTVGKGNSAGAVAMADEWLEKLRRYTQVSEVQIKPNPKKTTQVAVQVKAEGEKVLKALSPGDLVVLLDERGREVTSEGMARLIASAGDKGASTLVFCIGGPYGHSDEVRARANDCIRLSVMVLNHQVAYVVLLEQLYRGWTILRGEPYHH